MILQALSSLTHTSPGGLRQAANQAAYGEKAADVDKEYLFKYVVSESVGINLNVFEALSLASGWIYTCRLKCSANTASGSPHVAQICVFVIFKIKYL